MPVMSASERTELKKIISAFYKIAGRTWGDRSVNYCVAGTFAVMLNETIKASKSLAWLPISSGKPSLPWLLGLLIKGLTAESIKKLNPIAVMGVIERWNTELVMSSTLCAK